MPSWLSVLGAVGAAIVTFVISWSALKPRQRLFATRLVTRWIQRGAIAFALCYVFWINASFLLKEGPIRRGEVFLLFIANAEAVILLLVYVVVKQLRPFMDRRNECWRQVTARVAALESSKPSRPTGSRSTKKQGAQENTADVG